jgi:phosphoethanolamine N-methyltransferase
MPGGSHQSQYNDAVIASVEMVCGDGFMSPGGEQCVARIVEGLDICGKKVLEVGCGLGGVLVALVRNHHAGSVHGMDLEASVLARAKKRVLAAGLENAIQLQQVIPGPFPVDDGSFDFVVCKEMLCHIEDKKSFYEELVRVIKPGGWLIGSDWLISNEAPGTPAYENWRAQLKDVGMIFHFASFDETVAGFNSAGLKKVAVSDNIDWITGIHDEHHERVHGSAKQALLDALGSDGYDALVQRTQNRIEAVENGTLLHCNFRAQK